MIGHYVRNPLDPKDRGVYQITVLKRIAGLWMYRADATNPQCIYATIGGAYHAL